MLLLEAFDTTTTTEIQIDGEPLKVTYDKISLENMMVKALRLRKKSKAKKAQDMDPLTSVEFVYELLESVVKDWEVRKTLDGPNLPVNESTFRLIGIERCTEISQALQEDYNSAPKEQ